MHTAQHSAGRSLIRIYSHPHQQHQQLMMLKPNILSIICYRLLKNPIVEWFYGSHIHINF